MSLCYIVIYISECIQVCIQSTARLVMIGILDKFNLVLTSEAFIASFMSYFSIGN